MPLYSIDFKYKLQEWGDIELHADDPDSAESLAYDQIKDTYPDVTDLEITGVKEVAASTS